MFNFDARIEINGETCATLQSDDVLYSMSTCNGAYCGIAQSGDNFRVSYANNGEGPETRTATDSAIGTV